MNEPDVDFTSATVHCDGCDTDLEWQHHGDDQSLEDSKAAMLEMHQRMTPGH